MEYGGDGMVKNICPGCGEVILSFGLESSVRCSKCGTDFKLSSAEAEPDSSVELIIKKWIGKLGAIPQP